MKSAKFPIITILFIFLLCACGSSEPIMSTSTSTPNPTATSTPTVTSSPTTTQTATEIPFTPTVTVEPGVVAGSIHLVSDEVAPFQTRIELRMENSNTIYKSTESGSDGTFRFENVDSGTYDIWILISDLPEPIAGCSDNSIERPEWMIVVEMSRGKATMMMVKGTLETAIEWAEILESESPGLKPTGFYAVTDIAVGSLGDNIVSRIMCH